MRNLWPHATAACCSKTTAAFNPCVHHLQGPEELFETTAQCLLSGVDRDALSGWGAIIYVVCVFSCHTYFLR